MKPTKAQTAALAGIAQCADESGWATKWPAGTSGKVLDRCVAAGWLEHSVRTIKGYGNLGWAAYRLTEEGQKHLPGKQPTNRPTEAKPGSDEARKWAELNAFIGETQRLEGAQG